MDTQRYVERTKEEQESYEAKCRRCGRCCGVEKDPCLNLMQQADGKYFCKDYENRLRPQKTVGGTEFTCVEIRRHTAKNYIIEDCPYFA